MPKLSNLQVKGKVIALTTAIKALESSIESPPEDRLHETTVEIKNLKARLHKDRLKAVTKFQ